VTITRNDCSSLNILQKIFRKFSSKSLQKLFKLLTLIVFIYQTILLTIDYYKYETVVDLQLQRLSENSDFLSIPAISLCVGNKNESFKVNDRIFNKRKIGEKYSKIVCQITTQDWSEIEKDCNHVTNFVESLTPSGTKCLTMFSNLIDVKKYFNTNFGTVLMTETDKNFVVLIHQNTTPPHLFQNIFRFSKGISRGIQFTSERERIMPFPYETNCFENQLDFKNQNSYRSREDCIVKYYQRKEFEKCGCNRKWIYYNPENMTNIRICLDSNKCRFDHKYDKKFLDKICRKSCFNEYFDFHINSESNVFINKNLVFINYSLKEQIFVIHLSKMDLNQYFSSIGGLFSMWFGISLYNSVLFLCQSFAYIIKKYLIRTEYFQLLRFQSIYWINYYKLIKISQTLLISAFSALMLIQISDVIKSYSSYETITRFEANERQIYPRIILGLVPYYNYKILDNLVKIHPEIKQKYGIKKGYELHEKFNELEVYKILINYLLKSISDQKFDEMNKIIDSNNFIKECQLVRDKHSYDCKNSYRGINSAETLSQLTFALDLNNKTHCYDIEFDRIELKLTNLGQITVHLGGCQSSHIDSHELEIKPEVKTLIGFSSYSVKKLSKSSNTCFNVDNYQYSGNYSSRYCLEDCFLFLNNQTYGCLMKTRFQTYIDFQYDFSFLRYRICDTEYSNESMIYSLREKCLQNCSNECESINFNTKLEIRSKEVMETIVEIFPIKSLHFRYIETLKMDFNQLIFNCGGILGLWFGWTAISVVDLVTIFRLVIRFVKSRIHKLFSRINLWILEFRYLIINILESP
jgi:hypothetical protein